MSNSIDLSVSLLSPKRLLWQCLYCYQIQLLNDDDIDEVNCLIICPGCDCVIDCHPRVIEVAKCDRADLGKLT